MQHAQGDITRTPPASLASAHSPDALQHETFTLAESFKKGIKRDSTMFNPFKEKKWDTFRRHLKDTEMAQDEAEVLDITYQPNTDE